MCVLLPPLSSSSAERGATSRPGGGPAHDGAETRLAAQNGALFVGDVTRRPGRPFIG